MATPSLDDLAARVTALEERETQLAEQVQELQQEARVKAVAWHLNEVHEELRAFRTETQATLAAHGDQLNRLEDRVSGLDDRVETGFTAVQGALNEILRELRGR